MMFKVYVLWVPISPIYGFGPWVSKTLMGQTDPMGDPNMGMGPIYGYGYGP